MVKKMIFAFISIMMLGLVVLYGYTKVYHLVDFMSITRIIPVVVALFILVGIILLLIKKKTIVMVLAVVFLVSFIISNSISVQIIDREYQKVFKSGILIGNALDQFYNDNQIYPRSLEDLTPKYIDKIMGYKAIWEKNDISPTFSYSVIDNGNNYELNYGPYIYNGVGWYHVE